METFLEFMKSILSTYYTIITFIPLLIICIPHCVQAAHEFPVYRIQHYYLQGNTVGSTGSYISTEVKTLTGWQTSKQCIWAAFKDLNQQLLGNIMNRAGGLIILLPENMTSLSLNEKLTFIQAENSVIFDEVPIPIYFLPWHKDLESITKNIDQLGVKSSSKFAQSILGQTHFITIPTRMPNIVKNSHIQFIQGQLKPHAMVGSRTPTIIIVSHFDAQGLASGLSFGADSNGSGVAALLEFARLISKLSADTRAQPRFNIVFLLTGGGKMNYFGVKKWIDYHKEETLLANISPVKLQNVALVICFDTLAYQEGLSFHVSKLPSENSSLYQLIDTAKSVARPMGMSVEIVHKKISLSAPRLSWEHERFSISRLLATTISSLNDSKHSIRNTIFDTEDSINSEILHKNVNLLMESLVRFAYGLTSSDGSVLPANAVQANKLMSWVKFLSSHPRSAQVLTNEASHPIVNTLQMTLQRYLSLVEAGVFYSNQASKSQELEFAFYDVTQATARIYVVRASAFDLFLSVIIVVYIFLVYNALEYFPFLYQIVQATTNYKQKVQ